MASDIYDSFQPVPPAIQQVIRETPAHFANVRYNNPGAQYPSKAAESYGMEGYDIIGGGHKIARFPTPVHGAAANMDNLASGYVGMPIGQAILKWSGNGRAQVPGFDSRAVITPEMTRDPSFVVPFMKAVASGEAPGRYPMSDEQWKQAYDWYASKRAPDASGTPSQRGGTPPVPQVASSPGLPAYSGVQEAGSVPAEAPTQAPKPNPFGTDGMLGQSSTPQQQAQAEVPQQAQSAPAPQPALAASPFIAQAKLLDAPEIRFPTPLAMQAARIAAMRNGGGIG